MNEDVKKYGIMLFISIIVLIIELIFKIKGVIGLNTMHSKYIFYNSVINKNTKVNKFI